RRSVRGSDGRCARGAPRWPERLRRAGGGTAGAGGGSVAGGGRRVPGGAAVGVRGCGRGGARRRGGARGRVLDVGGAARPTGGPAMTGALLVAGTTSDAGKSVLTAGICRWLYRRRVKVAPFKAQNMSNHSAVPAGADG